MTGPVGDSVFDDYMAFLHDNARSTDNTNTILKQPSMTYFREHNKPDIGDFS